MTTRSKRSAEATLRNREPILAVLREALPDEGSVLELASGTGEHAVFFAGALPRLSWQPSDASADARQSIAAWSEEAQLANLLPPLTLDVTAEGWPVEGPVDAMVAINLVHISPWRAAEGLFAGGGRVLRPGGVLYLYGPYNVGGRFTAPSNEAFDASLRARDPAWGIRDVEAMGALGEAVGLSLAKRVAMPANNFSLIFTKAT